MDLVDNCHLQEGRHLWIHLNGCLAAADSKSAFPLRTIAQRLHYCKFSKAYDTECKSPKIKQNIC